MDNILGDTLATMVISEHERMDADQGNWKSHLDEVSQYFVPRKDNIYGQPIVAGEKKFNLLYDSEGVRAVDDLAAVLATTLVNPQSMWFGLESTREKMAIERVRIWLFNAVEVMLDTLNSSNFQPAILEVFQDLVSIGTAVLRIEDDIEDYVRFYTQTIYQVVVDENNKGDVDTVSRSFLWSKKKILDEYGKDEEFRRNNVEKELGDSNKEWEVIHRVGPRNLRGRLGRIGTKGMPWSSIHVIKDLALTVRESGFEEFPYAVPRWTKLTEEKLGRSPAMKALSDNKMLQEEKKVFIKGAQLRMAPPMQLPDQGFLARLKFQPFSSNYRRKGRDKAEPLFTGADPGIGVDLLEMTKADIRKAFLLDRLHVELGDRATRAEVIQKRDENLRVLAPFAGRFDRELLRPVIDRVFGVLLRKGAFGEPPPELYEGEKLRVKYMSMVAKSQMIVDSENFGRALAATEPMISAQPEILQNIDGDAILRKNFIRFGNDPNLLRSEKQVKQMREAQQAAIQQQADREQQLADAQTINQMGSADAKLQQTR